MPTWSEAADRPMRVLLASTTYYPAHNGQAVFVTHLAEGLARHGHEVTVVVPGPPGHESVTERQGVRVHTLRAVSLRRVHPDAVAPLSSLPALQRIVAAARPEIVHVHDHYPLSRVAARLARRVGAAVIGSNHFMPDNLKPYLPLSRHIGHAYDRVLWWWMLELYNRLDLATAQSVTAADLLRSVGLRIPVHPVSCGVDTQRFCPLPGVDRAAWRRRYGLDPSGTLLLYVGRLDEEKSVDVLLRALFLLRRDDVALAVVGKGAARPTLEALARELGLGARAVFTGFVPDEDLAALINSADVFVMPSAAELLSIATLEAMACGRPVVAARARALPELVTDGQNGYLFRAGDAADAAACLARIADEPGRWGAMGAESRRRALDHGIEDVLQRYEGIYRSLLDGGRPGLGPASDAVARTAAPSSRVEQR